MKQSLLLISLLVLIISACSSGPNHSYYPARQAGEPGYTERQLTDTQYIVSYTAPGSNISQTVSELALLRAAELTLEKQYQWFRVMDSDTEKSQRTVDALDHHVATGEVVTECGLLGCDSYRSPAYRGHHIYTQQSAGLTTSRLQISMGHGTPAAPDQVFDAAQLVKNLRPLLSKTDAQ